MKGHNMADGGVGRSNANPLASPRPGVSVLVASCDRYADVWEPFFGLFRKFWPDCPYPVYLGANRKPSGQPGVQDLLVWPDVTWSKSLRGQVERLPTTHVLLLLEDFFLDRPVDTAQVRRLERLALEHDASCMRLFPLPAPDRLLPGVADVGALDSGTPYRASTMAAIWRRDDLLALLRDDESAWDFENKAGLRSAALARPFLSVTRAGRPLSYLMPGLDRGVWTRPAVRLCRRAGVRVDLTARGVESRRQQAHRQLLQIGYAVRRLLGRRPSKTSPPVGMAF